MTRKLPQPQVRHGLPGSIGGIPYKIKAYGKMWEYEYSTPDYLTAKKMKTRAEHWASGYPGRRGKAIIRKFYDGRRPIYVIYARWVK